MPRPDVADIVAEIMRAMSPEQIDEMWWRGKRCDVDGCSALPQYGVGGHIDNDPIMFYYCDSHLAAFVEQHPGRRLVGVAVRGAPGLHDFDIEMPPVKDANR